MPSREAPSRDEYDVIIVGAGLGGLVAGAFLARSGRRVLMLDQHLVPGGNATVFHRAKKYEFDVGVHYLGDCERGPIPKILRALDLEGAVDFLELDPDGFDVIDFPELRFRTPKGLDRYRDRLVETFPEERAGIDRYCALAAAYWEEFGRITLPVASPRDLLRFQRVAPTLAAAAQTSLSDVLRECVRSRELAAVLCGFAGLHAVPVERCSAMVHLITLMHFLQGAYYPRGGGRALSECLAESIEGHGGEISLKRRVTEICVERGAARGVRTDRGEHLRSKIVISNADLKRTMFELVGADHLPPRFARRIEAFKMSLPLFVVYGATTQNLRELGLGNFNVHLHSSVHRSAGLLEADAGRLPSEAAIFFSSASLKDPTNPRLAPEGETNFQAITVAPADYAAWRISGPEDHKSAEYREVKQRFMDRIVEHLERRLIPGLRDHLTWLEGATPLTHERFVGATGGTSYGVENSVKQFGMFRQGHATPIRNLFLCGASTVSGHGVIGAMTSGVGAASAVLDDRLADEVLLSSASAQPLKC